jgi:hypothetical protein
MKDEKSNKYHEKVINIILSAAKDLATKDRATITMHQKFAFHPSSFILHPSSFVFHPFKEFAQ